MSSFKANREECFGTVDIDTKPTADGRLFNQSTYCVMAIYEDVPWEYANQKDAIILMDVNVEIAHKDVDKETKGVVLNFDLSPEKARVIAQMLLSAADYVERFNDAANGVKGAA